MTESDLYPAIIGAHSRGATRLFRLQSLFAWAGRIVHRTATTITLEHPHAVKIGAPGISDLGGLTSVTITPDMVGRQIAVAVYIEVKLKGKPTTEQEAFIATVRALGARAGIARSVEEAGAIISGD